METPERIPYLHWINSQLSIARHYGACNINTQKYLVDQINGDLVREDVYKREQKEKKKRKKEIKAEPPPMLF